MPWRLESPASAWKAASGAGHLPTLPCVQGPAWLVLVCFFPARPRHGALLLELGVGSSCACPGGALPLAAPLEPPGDSRSELAYPWVTLPRAAGWWWFRICSEWARLAREGQSHLTAFSDSACRACPRAQGIRCPGHQRVQLGVRPHCSQTSR